MEPKSEVFLQDCMEGMKQYPDKYFDLAIVDPPYGIGVNSMNMGGRKTVRPDSKVWDSEPPPAGYFFELLRVSKNQIIWGGNYFTEHLPPSMCWICWDKGQRDFSLADGELAWCSFNKALRIFSVSRGSIVSDGRIHPTQKPIKLYKWLLEKYATCKKCQNEGVILEDVVGDGGSRMQVDCEYCDIAIDGPIKILDTHLGSQSSRIAAYKMGFDFTGFELDPDYFREGCKRFEIEKMKQEFDFSAPAPIAPPITLF